MLVQHGRGVRRLRRPRYLLMSGDCSGVLEAFRPLGFKALCGRALAGLPPAREGFFIASTHLGWE
jgi:hypothetical protein